MKVTSELRATSVDATVIGAGPAGALAARQLAQRGLNVLLIDKCAFPRDKVCGCCISPAAAQMLDIAGLSDLLDDFGAMPLHELQVASGHMRLSVPLEGARSLSRKVLDQALVEAAIGAGVKFLPQCNARVGATGSDCAQVLLTHSQSGQKPVPVASKIVLVADGIGGTSLQSHPEFSADVRAASRIGTGTISLQAADSFGAGSIFMACGAGGYLGLVRLEDGSTDVAAAFDPVFLGQMGGCAQAATRLLLECGWTVPSDIADIRWQGTVPLTRRRRAIATTRVFVIGDAASYLEPFTGEGIGWALSSALSVVPLAIQAVRRWDESLIWRWEHTYAHVIRQRQRSTRIVTEVLRHSGLVSLAGNLFNAMPSAAATLTKQICSRWTAEELEWLRS
jgi:flavin-dependent dehydrogenase